jgi:serine/threonine-protein kinase
VIVDDAWHLKVTDFGIARAGASEMTETGSIMGTAQYLSPEQAQGHAVGATADLYSIGVMLYEMLCGRLPFEGESAVSVALKHLSEPPTPISQLRPDVHPALESVVMAALAKDPAHRWQTAEDFAEGLRAARAHIDAGAPVARDTAEFTPVAVAPVAINGDEPPPPPPRPEDRERTWPWFTIGLMALALLGLLAFLALSGVLGAEKREVPRVVGKQLIQAREQLERAGFDVRTERVRSPVDFDEVLDQDPDGGEEADEGSTVTLEVSRGPGTVLVPAVANRPREQAINELQDAGLKVSWESRPSDEIEEGLAIRTTPRAGKSVVRGSRVTLLVSSGPEQVEVPDVIGLSRDSAQDSLRGEGLKVVVREESSDEPEDEVIAQDPTAGTEVDAGSRITITVSSGPEQVNVPELVGLSAAEARRELRAAGLEPAERSTPVDAADQDGVVVDQEPEVGAEVDEGSTVVIVIGAFEETDTLQPEETPVP